ncbi:unnamed protein product [Staurois parvus]|uniref:Uncharacterized protein n=1 Tax=Staurois parvus TaxID=386267 RepID=A0ABN9C309_9NEOB|nr:unnamed protein product [Staurois parvus]
MKLSKMSWYADALRVPFTGTKEPSTDPALSFYVANHFVAELLLFPVASILL